METIGIGTAVLGEPPVVRRGIRRHLTGIRHDVEEEPERRIEIGRVDHLLVHVGNARVRIEPA